MNLIICTSPLQVMIAEKIIQQFSNEIFIGIMFINLKNSKQLYYSLKFKQLFTKDYCHIINTSKLTNKLSSVNLFLYLRYFFIKKLDKNTIHTVYLASIDSIYLHAILSGLNKNIKICTFDDGTANIDSNSMFYKESRHILGIFFYALLGNKYSLSKLKRLSKMHYSIYKLPNIINNTQLLEIITNKNIENKKNNFEITTIIHILIGQPILPYKEYCYLVKKVTNILKIDFYYAHPKENFIIPDMVYMQSNLIFEDFILNELKNNSNTKYKVFTFFSSAALNLYSLSTNNRNLEIVSIYSESIPKNYINNYNIFKTLGIHVISI